MDSEPQLAPVRRISPIAKAMPTSIQDLHAAGITTSQKLSEFYECVAQPQFSAEILKLIPHKIAELYRITKELESALGRPFTPDGHLVGSIGEVVAAYIYNLRLMPCSTPQVDALTSDSRSIQIKLSSRKSFQFRWSNVKVPTPSDLLIALQFTKDHRFLEIYNGPFPTNLLLKRRDSSNGQLSISSCALSEMNPSLLPQQNSLEEFNALFLQETDSVE